jgi:N-acetylglutamate synthase
VIQTVEELSMNAWPALQTLVYDGWLLRFANGVTRRANSVMPLYASKDNAAEKILFCEKVYADQGLPSIFKITKDSNPADLDAILAARGYQAEAQTSVQLLDLTHIEPVTNPEVSLTSLETEEWHAAFCRMNGVGADRQATYRQIVQAIIPLKCFATLRLNGQIIGCGLGVLQAGSIGLFDIVIDQAYRRQKYGEKMVQSLLAWGKQLGARLAYLQVMCNNAPAIGLYARLGFREEYQYWYRVKPKEPDDPQTPRR